MSKKLEQKGFTLIELLVVIAIIGLLASIVLVSLNTARAKARDTRRKADLKQIQTALEMYADDNNGNYPELGGWAVSGGSNTTYKNRWPLLSTALAQYIAKLPVDPLNTSTCEGPWLNQCYTYSYYKNPNESNNNYDLIGQLENTSDQDRCYVKCWTYYAPEPTDQRWCTGIACSGSYSNNIYSASH